jgi:hypothetical protein
MVKYAKRSDRISVRNENSHLIRNNFVTDESNSFTQNSSKLKVETCRRNYVAVGRHLMHRSFVANYWYSSLIALTDVHILPLSSILCGWLGAKRPPEKTAILFHYIYMSDGTIIVVLCFTRPPGCALPPSCFPVKTQLNLNLYLKWCIWIHSRENRRKHWSLTNTKRLLANWVLNLISVNVRLILNLQNNLIFKETVNLGPWVLTAASIKITVVWDIATRSFVEIYWRFRGANCIHYQETCLNDTESDHLWSVSQFLRKFAVQHPRRQLSSIRQLMSFRNKWTQINTYSTNLYQTISDWFIQRVKKFKRFFCIMISLFGESISLITLT